jgi:hypothetical protein
MIQLAYEPAFDPFHAAFRLFRLWPILTKYAPFHRDKLRILDFYLLFPFRIDEISLTQTHRSYRKLAKKYRFKKPYGEQPDARSLFDRMESMQIAAVETLASRHLVEPEALSHQMVVPTKTLVPQPILDRVAEQNEREQDLLEFLRILASDYDLIGEKGLKKRTALMEYRYDAV